MSLIKKDIGVLLVCAVVVVWSLRGTGWSGGFYFQDSWAISNSAQHARQLPKPIITDLDGDNMNEIVQVTHDLKIMVIDGSGVVPNVKAEATLVRTAGVRSGRIPVALGTGYLHLSEGGKNTQVVVVVTDGWTVLCFNNNLKLLWESTPVDEVGHNNYHEDVAILVAPIPVRNGDTGVVVVGGTIGNRETLDINHEHNDDDDEEVEGTNTQDKHGANANHFSYYAFDGKTGASRWKHEATDFYSTDSHAAEAGDESTLMPQHSYKQHVFSQIRHLGEVDWRQYKDNVLNHLPHKYIDKYDTSLALDKFVKKYTTGGRSSKETWASGGMHERNYSLLTRAVAGITDNGAPSESPKPNVIVAKMKTGLEVVHLYTGRPLCRLLLPSLHSASEYGAHADINGDGIIDQVRAIEGKPGEADSQCYALALTGVPPIDQLWNGTIGGSVVGGTPTLEGLMSKGLGSFSATKGNRKIHTTAPAFISLSSAYAGLNSIFFASSGQVTCYSPTGKLMWVTDTPILWDPSTSYPVVTTVKIEADRASEFNSYVVAIGGDSIALLSAVDGSIISTKQLQKTDDKPLTILIGPVFGDFNNDGFSDVIVLTNMGWYGVSIRRGTGSLLFPIIVSVVISVMIGLLMQSERSTIKNQGRKVY